MTNFLINSSLLCLMYIIHLVSSSILCSNTSCTVIPLNGKWYVTNNNGTLSLQGIIPGQIHLDLLRENIISEPYRGYNDEKLTWIALEDKWIYTRNITIDSNFDKYEKVILCFEGIDTIASVFLRDEEDKHFLFNASNQHRRYTYDVTSMISTGDITVVVELFSSAKLSKKYALEYPYPVDQLYHLFRRYVIGISCVNQQSNISSANIAKIYLRVHPSIIASVRQNLKYEVSILLVSTVIKMYLTFRMIPCNDRVPLLLVNIPFTRTFKEE